MSSYLVLIHNDGDRESTEEEWKLFFSLAEDSGMFRGGSALSDPVFLHESDGPSVVNSVGGYMRFEADSESGLRSLLERHPSLKAGATLEVRSLVLS